jgi:hypothetical protein
MTPVGEILANSLESAQTTDDATCSLFPLGGGARASVKPTPKTTLRPLVDWTLDLIQPGVVEQDREQEVVVAVSGDE